MGRTLLRPRNPIGDHLLRARRARRREMTAEPAEQPIRREPAPARREHNRCILHMECVTQHRCHIGRIRRKRLVQLRLHRQDVERPSLRPVWPPHQKEIGTRPAVRIVELTNCRIHIDNHRVRELRHRARRRPRDTLPELLKAKRRGKYILHRIAAHHHTMQRKPSLISLCKRRIPDRRRAERRHNQLRGRNAEIREPCRSKYRRRTAEAVPREQNLGRRMRTQLIGDHLAHRAAAVCGQCIRKERCLRVVKEATVHERHIPALRHRSLAHR